MKRVLVPIADGTEEMEAVIIIDILRRASVEVIVAGTAGKTVCSRRVIIEPDTTFDLIPEGEKFDAIVIPGGIKGVENLMRSDTLGKLLLLNRNTSIIAAICAGPLALERFGMLPDNLSLTSHPSVQDKFRAFRYLTDTVVVDGNIVTSRGAGTAFDFALKLVEMLEGGSIAEKIAQDIVLNN